MNPKGLGGPADLLRSGLGGSGAEPEERRAPEDAARARFEQALAGAPATQPATPPTAAGLPGGAAALSRLFDPLAELRAQLAPALSQLGVADGQDGRRAVQLTLDEAPWQGLRIHIEARDGGWHVALQAPDRPRYLRLQSALESLAQTLATRLQGLLTLTLGAEGEALLTQCATP